MTAKRALLGIHNKDIEEPIEKILELGEYEVFTADSVDQMLALMGLTRESPADASPLNPFELYIMDVNLGNPRAVDYEPATTIYQHVKPDVEAQRAKFFSISGNYWAVSEAQQQGIPCTLNIEFMAGVGNL